MWGIEATIQIPDPETGYSITRQIPTFHLSANLHGILTIEGAKKIAEKIINPTNNSSIIIYIYAYKLP